MRVCQDDINQTFFNQLHPTIKENEQNLDYN